jgi:hypothetical protein
MKSTISTQSTNTTLLGLQFSYMNPGQLNNEILILQERRRALATLIRYETFAAKLSFYESELRQVDFDIREREQSQVKAKVLPFPTKNPARSA